MTKSDAMMSTPLGLFITWTVYGTFLPGDSRGWRHRAAGPQSSRPRLELWHRTELTQEVRLLTQSMRDVTESAVREICRVRAWSLWAIAARSNHVHVVLTAPEFDPKTVRDQLKAKATLELRGSFSIWKDRPIWSVKGDIQFLDTEDDIDTCVTYVLDAQNRKDRE
ncbi:MAG: transposase [Planctomycetaceae bacterium]|nr:transposase [Planctomycetaceae bacterium]